jgi:Na+/alanine symporter
VLEKDYFSEISKLYRRSSHFELSRFGFDSVLLLDSVWTFSSIANGLIALPNLIGILLLTPVIKRVVKAGKTA